MLSDFKLIIEQKGVQQTAKVCRYNFSLLLFETHLFINVCNCKKLIIQIVIITP